METELAPKMLCIKKLANGQRVQKKKIVAVKFSNAVFSLLFTHDDLVMQALVWSHMVQFRVIWFGSPV